MRGKFKPALLATAGQLCTPVSRHSTQSGVQLSRWPATSQLPMILSRCRESWELTQQSLQRISRERVHHYEGEYIKCSGDTSCSNDASFLLESSLCHVCALAESSTNFCDCLEVPGVPLVITQGADGTETQCCLIPERGRRFLGRQAPSCSVMSVHIPFQCFRFMVTPRMPDPIQRYALDL